MNNLPSLSLEGKTAIVTGASRGIGLAIATPSTNWAPMSCSRRGPLQRRRLLRASVGDRAVGFEAHATSQERAAACVEETLSPVRQH